MTTLSLEIPGLPVSKKNRRRNFKKVSLPSVKFELWQNMAIAELEARYKTKTIARVELLHIHYYVDDNYRRDGDNMETSLLDMLVKAGWLEDDHLRVVNSMMWTWEEAAEPKTLIKFKGVEYA